MHTNSHEQQQGTKNINGEFAPSGAERPRAQPTNANQKKPARCRAELPDRLRLWNQKKPTDYASGQSHEQKEANMAARARAHRSNYYEEPIDGPGNASHALGHYYEEGSNFYEPPIDDPENFRSMDYLFEEWLVAGRKTKEDYLFEERTQKINK